MSNLTKEMVDQVGRQFIERGEIIAAGWAGYKLMFPLASVSEVRERRAFFAGAQYLFASIMNSGLDEGSEPTEADLKRMDNIARELKQFEEQMFRESTH